MYNINRSIEKKKKKFFFIWSFIINTLMRVYIIQISSTNYSRIPEFKKEV